MSGRIVIFANERVGLRATEEILRAGYQVAAVFTSAEPRRPKIADWADFHPLQAAFPQVPVHFIAAPKDPAVIDEVARLAPDLIVVLSWSQIIPPEILAVPPRGTVGVHYSLLPERRGGAPLVWAIIDGLERTGLTLFHYDDGVDTGDMVAQVPIQIGVEDTVRTVLDRIAIELPHLVLAHLDGLLAGTAPRLRQDEAKATVTPARKPSDGLIDLGRSDREIYDWVRAQTTPYPCAFLWAEDAQGRRRKLVVPAARFDGEGRLVLEGVLAPLDEG